MGEVEAETVAAETAAEEVNIGFLYQATFPENAAIASSRVVYTENTVFNFVSPSTRSTRTLGDTSLMSPPRFLAAVCSATRMPSPPQSM